MLGNRKTHSRDPVIKRILGSWGCPIEARPVEYRMRKTYESLTVSIKDTRYLLSIILEGKWSCVGMRTGCLLLEQTNGPALTCTGHYQKAEGRAVS